jgi:flagellar export protein FliJ
VKPVVRLDAVVRLRERDEAKARQDLAQAQRQSTAADKVAAAAQEAARQDNRARGSAAHWEMTEAAHVQTLREAVRAERAAQTASQQLNTSRQSYHRAYRRAESLRRLAEARRDEVIAEAEATERKQLDELGLLLFTKP